MVEKGAANTSGPRVESLNISFCVCEKHFLLLRREEKKNLDKDNSVGIA